MIWYHARVLRAWESSSESNALNIGPNGGHHFIPFRTFAFDNFPYYFRLPLASLFSHTPIRLSPWGDDTISELADKKGRSLFWQFTNISPPPLRRVWFCRCDAFVGVHRDIFQNISLSNLVLMSGSGKITWILFALLDVSYILFLCASTTFMHKYIHI